MNKRRILIIAVSVIFLSSAGIVTFLSAQDGGGITAVETGKGAPLPEPLETRYAPDRITRTTGSAVWRVSRDLGVLVSTDGGPDVERAQPGTARAEPCTRSPWTSLRSSRRWPWIPWTPTAWH